MDFDCLAAGGCAFWGANLECLAAEFLRIGAWNFTVELLMALRIRA